MANISAIKLPSGTTYTIVDKTSGYTKNTGTVTSVAASGSGGISISGSPITTSGTIAIGLNLSTAINGLGEGSSPAQRADYIVAQYAGGGTTTTTYHRRSLANIFAALNASDITTALGYTPYNATNPNGYTTNTGTVTSVGTGAGLTGGSITTSGTIKANLTSDTALSNAALSVTEDANRIYPVRIDKNSKLVVVVPWTNVNSSYLTSSSTLNAAKLSGAIPSAVTATTQASTDNSTKIATTAYVTTAIANLPEPMIFKGSVGTGGTITSLPTAAAANEGWTYKVITALSSPAAKVGDTVISNGSSWVVIPSGDEPSGTVTSITAGTGLNTTSNDTATDGGTITSSGTIYLSKSGVTAGSYGDSAAQTPGYGSTFKVPYITVDKYGRVTGISEHTVKIPASDNTNTTYTLTNALASHKFTWTLTPSSGSATTTTAELVQGTGITLTDDTSNKKITIANAGVTGVKGNAESSYRTGQVNLTAANLGAVALSGDTMTGNLVVPATRIANTYYGISFGRTTETPVETILYTGIKWIHGRHMPVIHITGYAYGLQSPVEFKIGFYLYGTPTCEIGWCGVTNMGAWAPEVYLFKYTRNNIEYVAVGFKGSCYFLQLQADLQDEMGKFGYVETASNFWSWSFLTTTGTIPAADGGTTCIQVPYKANILNPDSAKSVPWSGVSGKPTTTGSATTGISIAAHGTGTVIGVQSTTTTASKVTLGTAISVPNVTGNTDVTVPIRADSDTTVPKAATSATTVPIKNASTTTVPTAASSATTVPIKDASATACDDITAWSAGSGSASLTFTMDATDTKKLKIAFSHSHTAPSLSYTARSIIGVQSSTTSVTGVSGGTSIYGVQSSTTSVTGVSGSTTVRGVKTGDNSTTTASKVTLGTAKSIPNVTAATDVTVPIKNSSASTFVTGTTHTITDNGHTHSI